MSDPKGASRDNQAAMRKAADKLHHLSMRYVGAFAEIALGRKVGLLPKGTPGLSEMRDLIDLILLTRAEINAFTALLVRKGVFTVDEFTRQCKHEYEWLTEQKAHYLGVEVTDAGLVFRPNDPSKG